MIKKILLGLVVLVLAAQFIRPARNLSAEAGPNDINVKRPVPTEVQAILTRACYDCHSNNTKYPRYAEVQPVRWWLDDHISHAKGHLNFSVFGTYTAKQIAKKAAEIVEELAEHKMPLKSYTWMHPEARLTPEERKLVSDWAKTLPAKIVAP